MSRTKALKDGLGAVARRARSEKVPAKAGDECGSCGKPSAIGHYPHCMSAARPGWSPVPCNAALSNKGE